MLSLEDAQLLESGTAAEPGGITSLLDAEWLEAELEEALHALETEPQADLEPTDRFEAVKHVPDSAYPAYGTMPGAPPRLLAESPQQERRTRQAAATRRSPITPQDPALPDIVPVAAAGHAAAAAPSRDEFFFDAIRRRQCRCNASGDPRQRNGNRDEPRARPGVGDLRSSARNWRTESTAG
jgi:hypothetical protein